MSMSHMTDAEVAAGYYKADSEGATKWAQAYAMEAIRRRMLL